MNIDTEEIDETLNQILETGTVPNLETNLQCQTSLQTDNPYNPNSYNPIGLVDRVTFVEQMIERQLIMIPRGYPFVIASMELYK